MAKNASYETMSVSELQAAIGEAAKKDKRDKRYVAALAKSQFSSDIRRAIDETPGMDQSKLAAALGITKQSVSLFLKETANLTADTMAALTAAVGWNLVIRAIPDDEAMPVIPVSQLETTLGPSHSRASANKNPISLTAIGLAAGSWIIPTTDSGKESNYGHARQEKAARNPYLPA